MVGTCFLIFIINNGPESNLYFLKMHWIQIFRYTILTICTLFVGYEFIHIFKLVLKKSSYVAINQLTYDSLISPSITLCPG